MARNTNGKGFSLKDELFNRKKVQYLAGLFSKSDKTFNAKAFEWEVMKKLTKLELKERIVYIAETLESFLPQDYHKAAVLIKGALPAPLDPNKTDDDFGNFIFAPLGEYVVRNGLRKKDLAISLRLLKEITMRFSMEDAIRYFINAFPAETLRELNKWSTDSNYHVRRLVSEGTRPLLPWSSRLQIDYREPVQLLDTLHSDPTRYVTRSVANHLNDIAKREPDLTVATLKRWQKAGLQGQQELAWMTRHALRTLIKQGHPGALALLGYHTKPEITVSKLKLLSKEIHLDSALEFEFDITSKADEALLIDYIVYFKKANGSLAPKVFKLKQLKVKNGETILIKKSHPLPKDVATRTYYPGIHQVSLQINGIKHKPSEFTLTL